MQHMTSQNLKNISKEKPFQLSYVEDVYLYKDEIIKILVFLDYFSNISFAICLSYFLYIQSFQYPLLFSSILACILVLYIGEALPTYFGKINTEKYLVSQSFKINIIRIVFKPFSILHIKIISFTSLIFNSNQNLEKENISIANLKDYVEQAYKQELLDRDEANFIDNIMDFPNIHAKDIMTARTDMIFLNVELNYDEVISIIRNEGFSRYPVYENEPDNVIGILYVKDLFNYPQEKFNLKTIIRSSHFTFYMKPLSDLFKEMRLQKKSVSLVIDEYGGVEGMISIEDIVEKIVGTISDEYDNEDDDAIIIISKNEFIVDGSTTIIDFNKTADFDIESKEYDTIAGHIIESIDRFPAKNETILINRVQFCIHKCTKNRIEKVYIKISR